MNFVVIMEAFGVNNVSLCVLFVGSLLKVIMQWRKGSASFLMLFYFKENLIFTVS